MDGCYLWRTVSHCHLACEKKTARLSAVTVTTVVSFVRKQPTKHVHRLGLCKVAGVEFKRRSIVLIQTLRHDDLAFAIRMKKPHQFLSDGA